MTASIAPAAPREWPIIPFVELTGRQEGPDRLSFRGVVEHRGGAVGVDVVDVGGREIRALKARPSPGALRCRMVRLGDVKVVGGEPVTDDFREKARRARRRGRDSPTPEPPRLAQNHAGALAIERAAFLRRCGLKQIKADENQFRDRIIAPAKTRW